MIKFSKRPDMHTVRWYKNLFMVVMASGNEYDLTWPMYIIGLVILVAIFN